MTCFATLTDAQSVILSAIVAAAVGAASWLGQALVSAILWSYGRLSREREMLVALGAEIETGTASVTAYAEDATVDKLHAAMASRPNFKLFMPLDRDYVIFEQLKPDITKLPEAPIREIVRFYDGIGGFDTLLAAMQGERFESFPVSQRATIVQHMQAAAAAIANDGRSALVAISRERTALTQRQIASLSMLVLLIAGIATAVAQLVAFVKTACGLT